MERTPLTLISGTNHPHTAESLKHVHTAVLSCIQIAKHIARGPDLEALRKMTLLLRSAGQSITPETVNGIYYAFVRTLVYFKETPLSVIEGMEGTSFNDATTDNSSNVTPVEYENIFQGYLQAGSIADYQDLYAELLVIFKRMSDTQLFRQSESANNAGAEEWFTDDINNICFSVEPDLGRLRNGVVSLSSAIARVFGFTATFILNKLAAS